MAGSVRDILINLLGRETVSPAFDKAGRAADRFSDKLDDTADSAKGLGDETDKANDRLGKLDPRLRDAAEGARKLDVEIDKAQKSLKDLAIQFGNTDDAAQRVDLAKAMRAQQAELRRLTRSRGLLDGLVEEAERAGDRSGESAGRRFVRNFREQIGGPELVRAGVGAGGLVATGLVAGLLAGAGGVVLGAGVAAAVAGGVVVAARDSRVQAAGKELGSSVLTDLENTVGARLVEPTLGGIREIRQGWQAMRGDVDGLAREAARFVEPISRGLVGLVREFVPGLREGVAKAGPVVAELERGLVGLGKTLGDLFRNIDPEEAAAGLRFLFGVIDVGVTIVGDLIAGFGSLYLTLLDVRVAAAETGETLLGWAPLLGDEIKETAERWRQSRDELRATGDAGSEAGDKIAGGFRRAGDAADESARKVQSWYDLVGESVSRVVESEQASMRMADAFRQLGQAAREDAGKGIDESTEAGSRNRAALIEAATAANANAAAIRKTSGDHQAAAEVTRQARAEFLRAAEAMGAERSEAVALANSLFRIPNVERKIRVDTDAARSQVADYRRWLASQNLNKTSTITVRRVAEERTARGGNREFSRGGYVDGVGAKGVDSEWAKVAPGEGILTAGEVDQLGGRAGFDRLRQVIRSGGAPFGGSTVAAGAAPLYGAAQAPVQRHLVVIEGTGLLRGLRQEIEIGGGDVQAVLGSRGTR
ncbi:hypothetical protein ABZ738_05460 [Micromonospora sp. NPDC047793]|uniref:hypothetical protein n=1 Tax=Micromonospora sp. NPDC047793 TaxID=3154342 RepID=UPI0033F7FE89